MRAPEGHSVPMVMSIVVNEQSGFGNLNLINNNEVPTSIHMLEILKNLMGEENYNNHRPIFLSYVNFNHYDVVSVSLPEVE